ncbi:unnamed protein product, partial [Heligmosomoides polygyrus]|uniref:FGGY_N domain-containing protein n=1 Tax=Heligmosomoides polygyrus TaxID=6339 RepID=A0A183FEC4_HELPZ
VEKNFTHTIRPVVIWDADNHESDLSFYNTVFPGYGVRTLCELASYPDFDEEHHWDRCGNIMDYFACHLTGSVEVLMSESNAYCWGYSTGLEWNEEIVSFYRLNLQKATRAAAMKLFPNNLVIGTSSQLCFVVSKSAKLPAMPITTHIFPFTDDLTLLAAASMNGGNAIDAFVEVSKSYHFAIIFTRLFSVSTEMEQNSPDDYPKVNSVFTAERGSYYTSLSIHSSNLFQMLIGVCEGVIRNLFSLVPPELLSSYGVKKLFLVGSAKHDRFLVHIRRYLQEHEATHIELLPAETDTSAAYGAAL